VKIEFYHIDSFAGSVFKGNPAGVCLLEKPLPPETMQRIAFENNLSETAFVLKDNNGYQIRWFTPGVEVDLCGHGTLASAHVLFNHKGVKSAKLEFASRSGALSVEKTGEWLYLDFPARPPMSCDGPPELLKALVYKPVKVMASVRDYLAIFATEGIVKKLAPDMERLKRLDKFGVIVTAPGDKVDFVSRFFCPGEGIPEDPVTGSAHCTLIPYWAEQLGKNDLNALQVSARGGQLNCRYLGDRVKIGGQAVTYSQGWIEL
jgi:predicted PhzF superfamily epimerase YddE/YHI9